MGFFTNRPEADALLLELWEQKDWSTTMIAEELQRRFGERCNKNMVIGRKHRLGASLREKPTAHGRRRMVEGGKVQAALRRNERMIARGEDPRPVRTTPFRRTYAPPGKRIAPQSAPREDVMPYTGKGVRFVDARDGQCRFFQEGQHGMDGFVCGAPVIPGKSWCPDCMKLMYVPGTAFGQRRGDRRVIRTMVAGSGHARTYATIQAAE